jgi:aldehyde dehydrogenase (NAD+)
MMTNDKRVPLISATGSTRMGRIVAQTVAGRLGRSLLVGNNAIMCDMNADIKMTVVGLFFWSGRNCGQRCTSTSFNCSRKYLR